jgi:diguanylate cyclase (GGDEF)-like protein/PAS domain S-box-containing protein
VIAAVTAYCSQAPTIRALVARSNREDDLPKALGVATGIVATVFLLAILLDQMSLPALPGLILAGLGASLLPAGLWWHEHTLRKEQQRSAQAFVQRLLDVIPEPVYVKDAQRRYVMINEAFARQRGEPHEKILGLSADDLAPDEQTARSIHAEDLAVLAGSNVYKEDLTRNPVTGVPLYRIVTKGSCLDLGGRPVIVGASFDVSRMHETEQRLQQALDRQTEIATNTVNFVQRLLNVIPEPVYIKDAQGHYIFINEAFARQRNQSAAEILGRSATELAPDEATARLVAREDAEVLSGRSIHKEDQKPNPVTGEIIHRIVTKGSCLDAEGKPVIIGANFDITALRKAQSGFQEALGREREHHQRSLEFIQRVLDLLPYPVYVKDAQSRYITVNQALADDYQMPRESLLDHMGLNDNTTPEGMRAIFEEDGQVLAGERILREDHVLHPATGAECFRIIAKGTCLNALGERVIVGTVVDLTSLRQAEREIRDTLQREVQLRERTEAFIQRLIDVMPDPVYVKRADGRYLMINDAFAEYQARSKQDLLADSEFFPHLSDDSRQLSHKEDVAVLAGGEVFKEEHTVRRATGEEIFRIVTKRRSTYVDGEAVVVGVDRHITKWRIAERELKAAFEREVHLRERTQAFVQRLIDVIPDPVYVKKAGSIYVMVNDAFLHYHQRSRELVLNNPDGLPFGRADTRRESMREDAEVLGGKEICKEEHTTRKATGEEVFRIVTKRRSTYFDGIPVIVGIDHHITRWRVAERELQRLAQQDTLTGLSNRRHFREEAESAVARAIRYGEPISLIMLDLDHFKQINDRWGHAVGDEVLVQTVRRCEKALRTTDLLARWGGEEFIVLLPHTQLAEAMLVARRLGAQVANPQLETSQGALDVTLSGGVAQWQAGETLDQFISSADAALYRAKEAGRNRMLSAETSTQQ